MNYPDFDAEDKEALKKLFVANEKFLEKFRRHCEKYPDFATSRDGRNTRPPDVKGRLAGAFKDKVVKILREKHFTFIRGFSLEEEQDLDNPEFSLLYMLESLSWLISEKHWQKGPGKLATHHTKIYGNQT